MKPRPEVTSVLLWCDTPVEERGTRYPRGRPTLHDYYRTQECLSPELKPDGTEGLPEPAYEHLFRCRNCAATRRYGIEDRLMS